jgi:hypothetical protein
MLDWEHFLYVTGVISLYAPDRFDSLLMLLSWLQNLCRRNDLPKRDLNGLDTAELELLAILQQYLL